MFSAISGSAENRNDMNWKKGMAGLLFLLLLCLLTGCSAAERICYGIAGGGRQTWEDAAQKEGFLVETEDGKQSGGQRQKLRRPERKRKRQI